MGRTKIIETEEQRRLRFKHYQEKYYSDPINQQTVYKANQHTQAERFKRWYDKQRPNKQQDSMIIEMPSQIYYTCNNKIFYNPYLAYYEQYKTGKSIEFYCYDDEYDLLDWTQEPEQSFETLMDGHAINLRNKYEKIILPWSGGTDSHTIYNVFVRNKLHIDEIIICTDGITTTNKYIDWMQKYHQDKTTKISVFEADVNIKKTIFDEEIDKIEDWAFENKSNMPKLGLLGTGAFFDVYALRNYSAYRYAVVMGYEKPFVYFKDGNWYFRQSDNIMGPVSGRPNLECFFMEPVINLKQCHMVKNHLKLFNLKSGENHSDNASGLGNADTMKFDYYIKAKICGRHDELTVGASAMQKEINNKGYKSTQISHTTRLIDFNQGEKYLADAVKSKDQFSIKYLKGIHNIMSEKKFADFLNQSVLVLPNSIYYTKTIWSKSYNLGT